MTGVAGRSSSAAASSDVDDENTAVMEDSMTAGGVLGGGVMGSGDFDRISMIPIGLSIDDDGSMEDVDDDPYFPFEESVRPAATLNGGGLQNDTDGPNGNGRRRRRRRARWCPRPSPTR